MKKLIALFVFAVGTLAVQAQSAREQAETFYKQGMASEKAGDPASAKAAYEAALQHNSGHANARYRLGQVKINAAAIRSSAVQSKIGAVLVPVYQLDEASLREAVEALGMAIDKQTGGEIAPNFVIEDPQQKLADARISLQLKNVPVKGILDYLLTQAKARARYDEHAVVILPL